MSEVLLNVDSISKNFGGIIAVDNISFDVRVGQIKAIIGPNGSGKTTLFNLISGHYQPSAGSLYFYGFNITKWPAWKSASVGISRTFQNLALFTNMSVIENVLMGVHVHTKAGFLSSIFRTPKFFKIEKEAREIALQKLSLLGISHIADKRCGELPFGLQRLVEMARALAAEPRLLLLDEPASGLDIHDRNKLCEIIKQIREEGVTILMVEHDMNITMNLAEEVIVIDSGKKICEGTPKEVQRDPEVIRIYLGEG